MILYDDVISVLEKSFTENTPVKLENDSDWTALDKSEMILKSETAYQLDGFGTTLVTSSPVEEGMILYGKDLSEISKDTPYLRLAIVEIDEDHLTTGERLYQEIRKISYVRYHVFPKGFMSRISSTSQNEVVRLSKSAVNKGISFSDVGAVFLKQYHKFPEVKAVKQIFVTLEDYDYKMAEQQIIKSEQITKTIDHILKNITMDCKACSLQKVCDEVEGMKELHFGVSQNNK